MLVVKVTELLEETPAAEEFLAEEKPAPKRKPKEDRPSEAQKATLELLFVDLERLDPGIEWRAQARKNLGVSYTQASRTQVQKLIDELTGIRDSLDPTTVDIPFE